MNRVFPTYGLLFPLFLHVKTTESILTGFPEVSMPDLKNGAPVAILKSFPGSFQYNLSCSSSMIDIFYPPKIPYTILNDEGFCRDLINFRSVEVQVSNDYPNHKQSVPLYQMPLQQTIDNQVIAAVKTGIKGSHLSSCCEQAACPETCLQVPNMQLCWLMVYTPGYKTTTTYTRNTVVDMFFPLADKFTDTRIASETTEVALIPVFEINCQACIMKDCTATCTNGTYSSSYSNYREDLQTTRLQCLPCKPGTWNTCKFKKECDWIIPEKGSFDVGRDIHDISMVPVFDCFPCQKASTVPIHFGSFYLDNELDYYCPGGGSAPVNCFSDDFVHNSDWTACVCKPGYYPSNETFCQKCEKGYMCVEGIKTPCPIHYFQDSEGMTSCDKCVQTGDARGVFRDCPNRAHQLVYCTPDVPGTQNTSLYELCIPCNQCKPPFMQTVDPVLSYCYANN